MSISLAKNGECLEVVAVDKSLQEMLKQKNYFIYLFIFECTWVYILYRALYSFYLFFIFVFVFFEPQLTNTPHTIVSRDRRMPTMRLVTGVDQDETSHYVSRILWRIGGVLYLISTNLILSSAN